MTDDVEAIKQLKARYFRTMDTKRWDEMRAVFTDDAVVDTTAAGGSRISGADRFLAYLREALDDAVTVHHGFMPEITVTAPDSATGIWAMKDFIAWPDGTRLQGFGHYHETYVRVDGAWRIASTSLTRLHVDITAPQAADAAKGPTS